MPAPTNIDASTATDFGTVTTTPSTIVQTVDDGAGTVYTVWYKWTPTADGVIGIFPWGDASFYIPQIEVRIADGVTDYLGGYFTTAVPVQVPVSNGQTYYFIFYSAFGGITAGTLTLRLQLAAASGVPVGAFLINDDTIGFPAAMVDAGTGLPLRFFNGFASGEGGDVLATSGMICVNDSNTNGVKVYNSDLTLAATTSITTTGQVLSIRANSQSNKFYIASPGFGTTHAIVYVVNTSGAITKTIGPFSSSGMSAAAPSPDDSVMYYTLGSDITSPIHRWDLVNNVALSDLAANVVNYSVPRPLLVLGDGTILVAYQNLNSPFDVFVRRYSTSGTVLNTYAFSSAVAQDFQLASAIDDPNSFWAWEKRGPGVSAFTNVKVSSGATLSSITALQFEKGAYQGTRTATPSVFFGHSESCPFLIARKAIARPVTATVPSTPPAIPGTCCSPTPSSTAVKSPTPSAGTNKGGAGFCTTYTGPSGIVPIGADPVDGDPLTGRRTVYVWTEVQHGDY